MKNIMILTVLASLFMACDPECVEGSICVDDYKHETENPSPDWFNITLVYADNVPNRTREAADAAARRLEEIIIGDLPESSRFVDRPLGVGKCGNEDEFSEIVDDVVIFVEEGEIDGKSNTIGLGKRCFRRSKTELAIIGSVLIDEVDSKRISEELKLGDLLAHEMMHALGFGMGWADDPLVNPKENPPIFFGELATEALNRISDQKYDGVPLDEDFSHLYGDLFSRELMDSALSMESNPISEVTIMILGDSGYEVDPIAADHVILRMDSELLIRSQSDLIW